MVGAIGIETIGIVALVAIVIFGGSKIPELARGLGRAKSEFQKGLSETSTDPAEGKAKGKDASENPS
jgi:sec-independent protein translocase protein TatA